MYQYAARELTGQVVTTVEMRKKRDFLEATLPLEDGRTLTFAIVRDRGGNGRKTNGRLHAGMPSRNPPEF